MARVSHARGGPRSRDVTIRDPLKHDARMKGTVILSHGLESGPNATKVSALARVADVL